MLFRGMSSIDQVRSNNLSIYEAGLKTNFLMSKMFKFINNNLNALLYLLVMHYNMIDPFRLLFEFISYNLVYYI